MSSSLASSLLSTAESYLNSLLPDEQQKAAFRRDLQDASATNVLEIVKKAQNSFNARPELKSAADKMKGCMQRLERFLKVIDIAIQADPTVSALVWAGLRLLFQLLGDFSSFFDRLIDMIDSMMAVLPDYADYMNLFQEDDELKGSIVLVYEDLMDFLRIATKIFLKQKKPRRALKVALDIMWTPFDQRFNDIIKRFMQHEKWVRNRAQIASMKKSQKAEFEAEMERKETHKDREILRNLDIATKAAISQQYEERRENTVRRLLDWLNPISCEDKLDYIANARHPQTGSWVVRSPEYTSFVSWSDETDICPGGHVGQHSSTTLRNATNAPPIVGNQPRICELSDVTVNNNLLWIYGNPGCGKTWLTAFLIEDLGSRGTTNKQPGSTVAYYFCDYVQNTKLSDILRSVLAQILLGHKEDQAILDAYCLCFGKAITSIATSNLMLMQLLKVVSYQLSETFIVVDGVDECQDRDELWNFLAKLSQESSLIKVLLLGRDSDYTLRHRVTFVRTLEFESSRNFQDILAYSRSRIHGIIDYEVSHKSSEDKNDLAHRFATASNGMFLWVKLMIDLVSSPFLRPKERLEVMESISFPEGLASLYVRIFHILSLRSRPERRLAAQILTWTSWSHHGLTLGELEAAIDFPGSVDFSSLVRASCAGIIEITRDSKVQFIHLSAKEFIQNCREYLSETTIDLVGLCHQPYIGNNQLALDCLEYLSAKVPAQSLSDDSLNPTDREIVQTKYPLLKYATFYWISHLDHTLLSRLPAARSLENELLVHIHGFVTSRERILMWTEAQYLLGLPLAWDHFQRLLEWVIKAHNSIHENMKWEDIVEATTMFVREYQDLQAQFNTVLGSNPHQVWTGITDWSVPGGLLNPGKPKLLVCHPEAPTALEEGNSSPPWDTESPIAVLSEVSTDSKNLLVCGVWASKAFSTLLQTKGKSPTNRLSLNRNLDFKGLALDWILRLETWDLSSRKKTAAPKDLPLDEVQVERQLRASICYDQLGSLRFGFPMALSPNLELIAVLGTVYRIESATPTSDKEHWWLKRLNVTATEDTCYHDYRITLSPCNRFVAYHIARRYREPPHLHRGETVEVFDLESSSFDPIWQRDVPCFADSPRIREDGDYESVASSLNVAFHPKLSLIAWAGGMMGTFISDFIHQDIGLGRNITHRAIEDLRFSHCGRLLFGKSHRLRLCFAVDEAHSPLLTAEPTARPFSQPLHDQSLVACHLIQGPQVSDGILSLSLDRPLPLGGFQIGGAGARNSQSAISLVDSGRGQLDLQQISNTHGWEERRIASFPRSVLDASNQPLVVQHANPAGGSVDELSIVLSKAGRSWYTNRTRDPGHGRNPLIYTRPISELGPWRSTPINGCTPKRKIEHDSAAESEDNLRYLPRPKEDC